MNKRPLSITVIGWIFVLTGAIGFAYHLSELNARHPFDNDGAWVLLARILAIAGGLFLLYGYGWARCLLIAWLAYHVVLSAFHSTVELTMHALLLIVIAYFLLRPHVSTYLRDAAIRRAEKRQNNGPHAP
jgi:uncharacterized membrane protein HdeD (DUF308 family)